MHRINVHDLENLAVISSCIPHIVRDQPRSLCAGPCRQNQTFELCHSMEIWNGIWVTQCNMPANGSFGASIRAFSSVQPYSWHTHILIHLVLTPGLEVKYGPLAKVTDRELAINTVGAEEWDRNGSSALGYIYQTPTLLWAQCESLGYKFNKCINIYVQEFT